MFEFRIGAKAPKPEDPLTAEEQRSFNEKMAQHAAKLRNEFRPPKPAPDGFAHWHKAPHNIDGLQLQPSALNEGDEGKA